MGLTEMLINKGFTLPGQDPNIITSEGGDPQPGVTGDRLTTIARALQASAAQQKMKEQEKQKKVEDQMSMYKTLREAGYTPAKAHAAVIKGEMPKDIPGMTGKERDAGLEQEKTKAEIAKIKAETDVVGTKKGDVESRILNKIANGESLLPGEEKIYEDVIKKKNPEGLANFLAAEDGVQPDQEQVKLWSPAGKAVKAPKKNLEKLLKAGYKPR